MTNTSNQLRIDYLQKVFELTGGHPLNGVHCRVLATELGISNEEQDKVFYYLKEKDLVKHFMQGKVILTARGIDELEKFMEKTYAEKELLVLKKIYEMGKNNPRRDVNYFDLPHYMDVDSNELSTIVDELHRKKFLGDASDECVRISPKGVEFLEGKSNSPNLINRDNINNFNFHAPVGAFQNQTNNSSQNVNQPINITDNSDFNTAIESLTELVKTSSLSNFKKEDLITDIERIQNLAKLEPSSELVEHAKSKINYLDTAIKATDLAAKASPYFPQIYAYFEKLLQ